MASFVHGESSTSSKSPEVGNQNVHLTDADDVEGDVELENSQSEDELSDDPEEEEISTEQRADQMETWQEELDDSVSNQPTEIKDWATLRAQIKADLKKNISKPRDLL